MNIMEENKKKHYVVPSMEVYEIEPTQLLVVSNPEESGVGDGDIDEGDV